MTMFIRKEVEYLITPFEESQLHLSDEIIPPNEDDDTFVKALEELDARIDFGEEYGDWEADFFAMKDPAARAIFTGCKPRGSRDIL